MNMEANTAEAPSNERIERATKIVHTLISLDTGAPAVIDLEKLQQLFDTEDTTTPLHRETIMALDTLSDATVEAIAQQCSAYCVRATTLSAFIKDTQDEEIENTLLAGPRSLTPAENALSTLLETNTLHTQQLADMFIPGSTTELSDETQSILTHQLINARKLAELLPYLDTIAHYTRMLSDYAFQLMANRKSRVGAKTSIESAPQEAPLEQRVKTA